MAEKWYDKSIQRTEQLLETDVSRGLTREAVVKRRKNDGKNEIYPTPKKSFRTYVAHLLTDYISILLLVTLLIAAAFGVNEYLGVMLITMGVYYALMIFSYVKAQKVLESTGTSALPNAKVLRGGRIFMIKQTQLVRGDVIYISAGDIVPCDARLIESSGLEILEVNVTSVSHTVRKDARFISYHELPPARQQNMVFASTIVTRGTGRAICCETGADTLVCQLHKNQPILSHEKLPIFDRVSAFCKKWTLAMTVMILVLTVIKLLSVRFTNEGLFGGFLSGLSLAVSSMSEFYTAFAYIVLACGIFGAVNRKKEVDRGALIKNSAKISELKDLTCLVLPKDAAFTIHDISVGMVYANGETYAPGDHGYRRNAARVLRYALISTGLYGAGQLIRNNNTGENVYSSEEDAIIKAAEACSEYNVGLEKKYPMVEHRAKGPDCRFETTLVRYENSYVVSLRGDYGSVLPNCRYYTEDSRVYEMTDDKLNALYIEAEKLARLSYRVIAIASRDVPYNNLRRLGIAQSELTLEGFLAVQEPVLPGAALNVNRCRDAGLKVIMITPDVSENNWILAENLGILTEETRAITGYELANMKEGLFRADIDRYTLYQGLTLTQRRSLVRFLKEKGERVGYLCSELDEIILMKEADVGFSRSVTLSERAVAGLDLSGKNIPIYTKDPKEAFCGCEALKFVSDIVVSETEKSGTGGFNAIFDSILYAKAIYSNLHRMVRYMIASQLSKLVLVFFSVLISFTALTPPQILFCGLIVDFFALLVIAFEKPDRDILGSEIPQKDPLDHPVGHNIGSLLTGLLLASLTIACVVLSVYYRLIEPSAVSCFCFFGFMTAQLALLSECRREKSLFARGARFNGAYLFFVGFLIVFCLLLFFTDPVGVPFGGRALGPYGFVASLLPTVAVLLVSEVGKAIRFAKRNRAE